MSVADNFLLAQGVKPYTELPLWVPELPKYRMLAEADSGPAERHGLTFRPIQETIAATLTWASENAQRDRECGLPAERESKLLQHWHQTSAR